MLAQWFVRNLGFSVGTRTQFEGRGGQIWGYFILVFVLSGVLNFIPVVGFLISQLIGIRINLAIIRWFFRNLRLGPGGFLDFTGSYWPLVGWNVLLLVSFLSIIGWAWVLAALARWYCRNIYLDGVQVAFVGDGWGFLWRGFIALLGSILIITIPWLAVWYVRWVVRNVVIQRVTA